MRQNDGGPAFPTPESHGDDYEGMSLRDYFAAKAMQGILATGAGDNATERAAAAYEHADAMLSARVK